jgi:uncharacterized membrane protein YdcZ (DUF606 family)
MHLAALIPLTLGIAAVLQSALNRRISVHLGFPKAVMLTNLIAFVCAFALSQVLRSMPSLFPPGFSAQQPLLRASWWYVVPGLCGFAFILGMPLAFGRLGVFQSLLLLIGSQLVVGLFWDQLVEGRPVTPLRIVGALITLFGAVLVLRK